MNILLTNHDFDSRGGSQTWVLTMLTFLSEKYNVDIFTMLGNTLTSHSFNRNKHYDLALINHNSCLSALSGFDIDVRIFTCHGIIPDLEKPIPGADSYVAISEETQEHMQRMGFNSQIIRNPIDTDHFSYSPVHKTLQKILVISSGRIKKEILEAVATDQELRNLPRSNIDPFPAISWADLVITKGRGCYESLSCGKNVIILNRGLSDGIVTLANISDLRKNNCSGRRVSLAYSANDLSAELSKYDPTMNLRPYILENNNVTLIASQYVNLYETIRLL